MITAELAKWQTLFDQVKTHKQLLEEALQRYKRGEGPFPTELKVQLAALQNDAMLALGEAAEAVKARDGSSAGQQPATGLPAGQRPAAGSPATLSGVR